MSRTLLPLLVSASLWGAAASAHHSFAAYYGPSEPQGFVTLEGTVRQFRYTNPHGILLLVVRDARGGEEIWTAETLAPAMLSRSGWARDSLKRGENVTIQGWRARDGSRLLRLQNVRREDGAVLGVTR